MATPAESPSSYCCASAKWSDSDADSSEYVDALSPEEENAGSSTETTPPSSARPLSPPFPSSHDTSRVPYHIPTIARVAKQIQAAATEVWNLRFQYKNVFALLLFWEDDDLNVAPEVASLCATLRDVYNYETYTWTIPTTQPTRKINQNLLDFLSGNDDKGNLVIFYYAGHAIPNQQGVGTPLWSSRRTHGNTMFSGSILSMIQEAESDFLLLFDCCNAYHPSTRLSGSGENVIEVVSAVGFGGIAAEPGTDSFTHHLDEALALAKRHGPLKVVDLYVDIINRLAKENPRRLRQGKSFVVDDIGPVEEQSRRQCPVHYWISGRPRSITLAPLQRPAAGNEGPSYTAQASTVASSSKTPESSDNLAGAGIIQIRQAAFPQVLICFRVSEEPGMFNTATWVKWLCEAPREARDLIKIEGCYSSLSTLLIVRMPVQIWSTLPETSAASFLGFITTGNDGPRLQRVVDHLLGSSTQHSTKFTPSENEAAGTEMSLMADTGSTRKGEKRELTLASNQNLAQIQREPLLYPGEPAQISIRDRWGAHRQTLEGHGGRVMAVAFSPDGQTLASASYDRTVRFWDVATGVHQQTLEGHGDWVRAVAFSPDGQTLASASYDGTVRLWDAATGVHRQTLEGHGDRVMAVAFSPDGQTLASASYDRKVRLWDAATGVHRQTLEGHGDRVMAVAFSPDGQTLASASYDGTVRLWDTATGVKRRPGSGTRRPGSNDKTVRLWDAATGAYLQTLEGHGDWVTAVAFSKIGH